VGASQKTFPWGIKDLAGVIVVSGRRQLWPQRDGGGGEPRLGNGGSWEFAKRPPRGGCGAHEGRPNRPPLGCPQKPGDDSGEQGQEVRERSSWVIVLEGRENCPGFRGQGGKQVGKDGKQPPKFNCPYKIGLAPGCVLSTGVTAGKGGKRTTGQGKTRNGPTDTGGREGKKTGSPVIGHAGVHLHKVIDHQRKTSGKRGRRPYLRKRG